MKISFITTVLNEENSIEELLESLNVQSQLPDEVIITDGGSKDNTANKIRNFQPKKKGFPKVNLIQKKGNRSVGRNEAISKAEGEIIVCTDSGCALDKDWIKKIVEPFKDRKVDVVAGYYIPISENYFQKSLATYTCVMPDKLDSVNFLPSSRSIAFKKAAWKKVNGYPEFLDTCEDLYFARELKKMKFKFYTIKDAIVYWPQRKNLIEAFFQFYRYAQGDGMGRFFRNNTPFLFARYIMGFSLVLIYLTTQSSMILALIIALITLYLIWSVTKNYRYVKNPSAIFYLPLLQLTSDIAVIFGTSLGFIKSFGILRKISLF